MGPQKPSRVVYVSDNTVRSLQRSLSYRREISDTGIYERLFAHNDQVLDSQEQALLTQLQTQSSYPEHRRQDFANPDKVQLGELEVRDFGQEAWQIQKELKEDQGAQTLARFSDQNWPATRAFLDKTLELKDTRDIQEGGLLDDLPKMAPQFLEQAPSATRQAFVNALAKGQPSGLSLLQQAGQSQAYQQVSQAYLALAPEARAEGSFQALQTDWAASVQDPQTPKAERQANLELWLSSQQSGEDLVKTARSALQIQDPDLRAQAGHLFQDRLKTWVQNQDNRELSADQRQANGQALDTADRGLKEILTQGSDFEKVYLHQLMQSDPDLKAHFDKLEDSEPYSPVFERELIDKMTSASDLQFLGREGNERALQQLEGITQNYDQNYALPERSEALHHLRSSLKSLSAVSVWDAMTASIASVRKTPSPWPAWPNLALKASATMRQWRWKSIWWPSIMDWKPHALRLLRKSRGCSLPVFRIGNWPRRPKRFLTTMGPNCRRWLRKIRSCGDLFRPGENIVVIRPDGHQHAKLLPGKGKHEGLVLQDLQSALLYDPYTVQSGDSLESIAAAHSEYGLPTETGGERHLGREALYGANSALYFRDFQDHLVDMADLRLRPGAELAIPKLRYGIPISSEDSQIGAQSIQQDWSLQTRTAFDRGLGQAAPTLSQLPAVMDFQRQQLTALQERLNDADEISKPETRAQFQAQVEAAEAHLERLPEVLNRVQDLQNDPGLKAWMDQARSFGMDMSALTQTVANTQAEAKADQDQLKRLLASPKKIMALATSNDGSRERWMGHLDELMQNPPDGETYQLARNVRVMLDRTSVSMVEQMAKMQQKMAAGTFEQYYKDYEDGGAWRAWQAVSTGLYTSAESLSGIVDYKAQIHANVQDRLQGVEQAALYSNALMDKYNLTMQDMLQLSGFELGQMMADSYPHLADKVRARVVGDIQSLSAKADIQAIAHPQGADDFSWNQAELKPYADGMDEIDRSTSAKVGRVMDSFTSSVGLATTVLPLAEAGALARLGQFGNEADQALRLGELISKRAFEGSQFSQRLLKGLNLLDKMQLGIERSGGMLAEELETATYQGLSRVGSTLTLNSARLEGAVSAMARSGGMVTRFGTYYTAHAVEAKLKGLALDAVQKWAKENNHDMLETMAKLVPVFEDTRDMLTQAPSGGELFEAGDGYAYTRAGANYDAGEKFFEKIIDASIDQFGSSSLGPSPDPEQMRKALQGIVKENLSQFLSADEVSKLDGLTQTMADGIMDQMVQSSELDQAAAANPKLEAYLYWQTQAEAQGYGQNYAFKHYTEQVLASLSDPSKPRPDLPPTLPRSLAFNPN